MSMCREEVEEFFEAMDRDFDGRLSFEEFMGEECQIEKLFKNMDKDGDGLITKEVNSYKMQMWRISVLKRCRKLLVKPTFTPFDFAAVSWKYKLCV